MSTTDGQHDLIHRIRDVPDFPKPGIVFKDITPLLAHPPSLQSIVRQMSERVAMLKPDAVVGIEARGFIFGTPIAFALGLPFIPIRKPGKLPYRTVKVSYALEYGTDSLEMHEDAIDRGMRIVVVDDLLATGGTAGGTSTLVEQQGGVVAGFAFVIELAFLGGRQKLGSREVISLIRYD